MAVIIHQCPHCKAKAMTFPLVFAQANPNLNALYGALALCSGCHAPICMSIHSIRGKNPHAYQGDLGKTSDFVLIAVYPLIEKADIPEHVPDSVSAPFLQATESRIAGHYDAAGAMYRKSLDVGLKVIAPELKGKLFTRIESLASNHRITPSIKTWAHEIRLDGNDASHDEDAFTKAEADEMHAFTQLLLIYLFTLPEKVRLKGKDKPAT